MGKKVIISILILLITIPAVSQKKTNIFIAPTFSYRGGLLELSNYPNGRRGYPSYSTIFRKQFDTKSIGLDISSNFLKENLTISISTYFRYGHLYYDPNLKKEVNSFKGDLFVDFIYNFNKRKETSFGLFAGAGFGKANMGTSFTYAFVPGFDNNGNPALIEGTGSFSFNTARVMVGAAKGKWIFTICAMGSPDEDKQPNLSVSIEPKIAYHIFSFKIPVKKK